MDKTRPTQEEFHKHKEKEIHKYTNPLRDVILGGQDGLVNSLGIILGISAATSDVKILIGTVIAAGIAESISMGAVAYTSQNAQKDYYESERQKERKEIEDSPEMEKEEIRRIYEKKGFSGKVLDEVVGTITSNKENWLEVMMAEELHIERVDTKNMLKSAVIVTVATAIGHLIPLLPFFFTVHLTGLAFSIVISTLTLFAVGAYQAKTLVGSWWKMGIKIAVIGMGAAAFGFIVAKIFHAST